MFTTVLRSIFRDATLTPAITRQKRWAELGHLCAPRSFAGSHRKSFILRRLKWLSVNSQRRTPLCRIFEKQIIRMRSLLKLWVSLR